MAVEASYVGAGDGQPSTRRDRQREVRVNPGYVFANGMMMAWLERVPREGIYTPIIGKDGWRSGGF